MRCAQFFEAYEGMAIKAAIEGVRNIHEVISNFCYVIVSLF